MDIVRLRSPGIHYTLSASLDDRGNLWVEGHDLSAWLEELFGTDEREYSYTVAAPDVARLAALLLEHLRRDGREPAGDDESVVALVAAVFSAHGIDASRELRTFLQANQVRYQFTVR